MLVARFLQRSRRNLAPAAEHSGSCSQGPKRRAGTEGNLPLEQVCLSESESEFFLVSLRLPGICFLHILQNIRKTIYNKIYKKIKSKKYYVRIVVYGCSVSRVCLQLTFRMAMKMLRE